MNISNFIYNFFQKINPPNSPSYLTVIFTKIKHLFFVDTSTCEKECPALSSRFQSLFSNIVSDKEDPPHFVLLKKLNLQ